MHRSAPAEPFHDPTPMRATYAVYGRPRPERAAPGLHPLLAAALLAVLLAVAAGCDSAEGPPTGVAFDGTVQVLVLGGPDAYLLAADAPGTFYYPLNLPAELREEGARVRVEGLVKDYRVYFETALEITRIDRLSS